MVIAVDFDGTLCKNLFPYIGEANTELINKLIQLKSLGAELILWTCREGELLQKALDFCKANGLEFDNINSNSERRVCEWGTDPRKVGADYYIDDKSVLPDEFCRKSFEFVGNAVLEKFIPKSKDVKYKIVINPDGYYPQFECCGFEPLINHPQDLDLFKFCPNCGKPLINTVKYKAGVVK